MNGAEVVKLTEEDGLATSNHDAFHFAPDGALWFAADDGLYRYEEATFTDFTVADGLADNKVRVSVTLADGAVWVSDFGYDEGGRNVTRFDPAEVELTANPFREMTISDGLKQTNGWSLTADNVGRVWVGGLSGPQIYDPTAVQRNELPFRTPLAQSLKNATGPDLLIDSRDTLWIANWDNGLWRFPLDQLDNPDAVATRIEGVTNVAGKLYEDVEGAIWCLSSNGIPGGLSRLRFDAQGNPEVDYYHTDHTEGLPSDGVYSICDGPDGLLYVGTDSGLARFDRSTKEFEKVESSSGQTVPYSFVAKIVRDEDGVL